MAQVPARDFNPHEPEPPLELSGQSGWQDLDYLARNRAAWDRWAPQYATRAPQAWREDDLRWGLWDTPESELNLLSAVEPGSEVVELGCGTAGISAWLARNGAHPVAVDFSHAQLGIVDRLQRDFEISFPLILANAEDVPFDNDSFDVAVSEYGASLWCNPRRWLPEAGRLLRPGGRLIFFTNAPFLMACTPEDRGAAGELLVRDYFSAYRVEFPEDDTVEFHLTHGHWIRLLRASGFELEDLVEVRPRRDATPRFAFTTLDWARRWPSEEVWIARKTADGNDEPDPAPEPGV